MEHLIKSEHLTGFLEDDLRASLHDHGPVEALVIMDLIEKAVNLRMSIKRLIHAVECPVDE